VVHPAPDQAPGGVIEPSEAERQAREAENLRAVFQSLREPRPEGGSRSSHAGRAAAGAAGAGLLFILGKAKFFGLLAGLVKFKTLATMLLSIGAYAVEWGWLFAAGFVLLIFVHEMGHAVAMRLEGIPAGAPVFIPFVGAFIAMQGRPRDAAAEARVAMAGPVAGSLAAWAVLWAGVELDQPLLRALGHTAVLINLFNLVPISPLDGGRVVMAFTRTYWVIGYAVGIVALLVTRSPLLLIVLLVGLWSLVRRWRHPEPGYEALTPRQRGLIAVAYAALILGLVATMSVGAAEGPATLAQ
jgi:Zn-dependent protease